MRTPFHRPLIIRPPLTKQIFNYNQFSTTKTSQNFVLFAIDVPPTPFFFSLSFAVKICTNCDSVKM